MSRYAAGFVLGLLVAFFSIASGNMKSSTRHANKHNNTVNRCVTIDMSTQRLHCEDDGQRVNYQHTEDLSVNI